MDIVGPMPHSRMVNKYILVVCDDYATHHSEESSLRSINVERMAEAVMEVVSRVGVSNKYSEQTSPQAISRAV